MEFLRTFAIGLWSIFQIFRWPIILTLAIVAPILITDWFNSNTWLWLYSIDVVIAIYAMGRWVQEK